MAITISYLHANSREKARKATGRELTRKGNKAAYHGRDLVLAEAKETTAGGIVLPDTAKDKPQKGKVIAVGDGRITRDGKRRELQVKVGDQVLFTSYAGNEVSVDGEEYLIMSEDDILAVLE